MVNPLTGARREWGGGWIEREVGLPFLRCLAALLLPGYALSGTWCSRIRRGWWIAYLTCFAIALVGLGHATANVAFGLMVGLHASAALALLARSGLRPTGWRAPWMTLGVLVAVILSVYWPLSSLVAGRVLMPLRSVKGVVVVNCAVRSVSVQRGETIAYRIPETSGIWTHEGVYLRAGFGLGPVLAVAGDRVEFGPEHLWVNGAALPRLGNMPTAGELRVKPGHWFIWPSVDRQGRDVGGDAIPATLMRVASVPQSDLIGRPFNRWFGRQQPVP